MTTATDKIARFNGRVSHDDILRALRGRIVSGDLKAGQRFPTKAELVDQYGANGKTIQRAMSRLAEDGFLVTRERVGSFVAKRLPCTQQIGLLMHAHPGTRVPGAGGFLTALAESSMSVAMDYDRHVVSYVHHDLERGDDHLDCERLFHDIQRHQLGGMIFTRDPKHLLSHPVLQRSSIPRVGLMQQPVLNCPAIWPDFCFLVHRALENMKQYGCKRFATVMLKTGMEHIPFLLNMVREAGLETGPEYVMGFEPYDPWAANFVRLLMHMPDDLRPDALLIMDDTLTEPTIGGLVGIPVEVPRDLRIISHANFPGPNATGIPITRLGFDAHMLLRAAIENLNAQAERREVKPVTPVPPRYEHETQKEADALVRPWD